MLSLYIENLIFFWQVHRVQADYFDEFRLASGFAGDKGLYFQFSFAPRAQLSVLEHTLQVSQRKAGRVDQGLSTSVSPSSHLFLSNQSLYSSSSASQKLLSTWILGILPSAHAA